MRNRGHYEEKMSKERKTNHTKGRNFRIISISVEMPIYTKIIFSQNLCIGVVHDSPLFSSNPWGKGGRIRKAVINNYLLGNGNKVRVYDFVVYIKSKAIPVTGHGGPWGCKTSRLPHFLEYRLTDGGEAVSPTSRPVALYTQEDSWDLFLIETESTPGPQCGWKD
jgi:hypothetical protein